MNANVPLLQSKAEISIKFNIYVKLLDNGWSFMYVLYVTINLKIHSHNLELQLSQPRLIKYSSISMLSSAKISYGKKA